jgi:hypothetical protein
MSDDLRPLLDAWPFDEHDGLQVRQVIAPDGQPRLQIRLELGLMELHTSGRPDGIRPYGFETLLDYHLDHARREMLEGSEEPFELDRDACAELHREAMQFYHRRVTRLKLADYGGAAQDAEHNLAIMDLLRDRAAERADWLNSEQYRAFVLTHWARARTMEALEVPDLPGAIAALDEGIEAIENLFREEYQRPDLLDENEELDSLLDLRQSLLERGSSALPLPREADGERLQREMHQAVAHEDYERAARLRDELRRLKERTGV